MINYLLATESMINAWHIRKAAFRATRHQTANALLAAALLLVSTTGCSQKQPWEVTYPTSGQIQFEGKPISGAQIVLVPTSDDFPEEIRPSATSDAHGKFVVSTKSQGDGAPAGEYKVTVTWQPLVNVGAGPTRGPNRLPPKYSQPATTTLTATIASGDNALPTYDLKRR